MNRAAAWWRGGVLYQIYPRSFADSNGDGHGDLRGIVERLDHLEWLGVDGVWLNPVTASPDDDWGYDVADYTSIHPDFGDMADLDALIAEASVRGIRVLLDIVPNHTSDRHPWFMDARSSRQSPHRDWYVWVEPRVGGSPPNNWLSVFGGPAWELDERTGQYYLHNFLVSMPDLNWWNEDVRSAFDEILRFWFDRGVAGFRIDVAHGLVKDRELRDNPPATAADAPHIRRIGQRLVYSLNRPEVHDVFRRWRSVADEYDPPRILVGETYVMELARMAQFYGMSEDELHMAMNFPFLGVRFRATDLRRVVEETESVLPRDGWPIWTASNHDHVRFPTRWCGGHEDLVRCALLLLLGLRGTPILYYGDEIGMPDTRVPPGRRRDPARPSRDGARTPMHWSAEPGAGFTRLDVQTWLPLGDYRARNVADQRRDERSILHLCRDLIRLRRELPGLRTGAYESIGAPPGVWAWRRGADVVLAVNLGDDETTLEDVHGTVCLATRRQREGQPVRGRLSLAPAEGAVVAAQ